MRRCTTTGCYRRHYARGLCWLCRMYQARHGHPPAPYANVNRLPVMRHP